MGLFRLLSPLYQVPREAVQRRYARRRARQVPRLAIGEVPENVAARLVGTIARFDGRSLEAPLSGRTCVYYALTIEEHTVKSGTWRELASDQRGLPFVLEDAGHRAVIDPAHAQVSAAYDERVECKGTFDAPPRARELLEQHGLVKRSWFWTEGLRFCEAILEVGERVAVIGAGTREPDPDARPDGREQLYRDGGRTRLRVTGSRRAPIVVTDDERACE